MSFIGFTKKRICAHCGTDLHLERRSRPVTVRLVSAVLPLRYYWCYYCRKGFSVVGRPAAESPDPVLPRTHSTMQSDRPTV